MIFTEAVDPTGPTLREFHSAPIARYLGSRAMSLISRIDDSIGS